MHSIMDFVFYCYAFCSLPSLKCVEQCKTCVLSPSCCCYCLSPLQTILQNLEHPPLLKDASWTLAAPKKEEKYHRSPSESIANNFSPTASNLKMRQLAKRKSSCIFSLLHGSLVK